MKFCIVVLSLAAALVAQPVIRVTSRLVEVNVIVRDKNGPVRGLAKSDFEILDRGKPRAIAFFGENSAAARVRPVEPLPANLFTNAPERRGLDPAAATVILFDGVNTAVVDQLRAKRQFVAFLGQLRPEDRVAVYSLGTSLQVLSDFTNDPARLAATVAPFRGRLDGSPDTPPLERFQTGDEKTDAIWNSFLSEIELAAIERRVQITVEAVEAIARQIGRIPGRKNLIWVSAAFPFEARDRQQFRMYAAEVRRMGRALSAANVAMYPVDARGLIGMPALSAESNRPAPANVLASQTPVGQPVMDMMAQATGGRVFKNNNDIRGAIRSVLDESVATYTLAFYPAEGDLDDTFHKLKVKVNRAGAEVRHRDGYEAFDEPPEDNKRVTASIRGAIESPLEASGVRLRVELARGEKLRFSVVVDQQDVELTQKAGHWTGLFDAAIAQRAADGRELGAAIYTLAPDLDAAQHEEAARKGLGFTKEVAPIAGAVEVKVVVADRATGRLGSVIVPLQP